MGAPLVPRQYEALAALARQPGGVLVANPGVLAARLVQEAPGVPTASPLLQPGLLPSSTAPPEMPGGLTIPPWLPRPLRRLYWGAVDAAGYLLVARALNRFRSELRLPPVRRLVRWWLSPDLVVGLFPPWHAPPQPEWPPQLRLAGFGRFDGVAAGLPDDVRGSARPGDRARSPSAPAWRTRGASSAPRSPRVRRWGRAASPLTRHPAAVPANLPPSVRHVAFAPFRPLLPLCQAVVHHGGVGTTAAAVEGGCPQVVLPLAWDQPDNAARVARLGAGVTLGPRRRTGGHLARARARVTAPAVRACCRADAEAAGPGRGLESAAEWVERTGAARHE